MFKKIIFNIILPIITLLTILPSCFNINNKQENNQDIIMIVFVHGTIGPYPSIRTISKLLKNVFQKENIKNTAQAKNLINQYTEELKKHSFHKNQPINKFGLRNINLEINENENQLNYYSIKTAIEYKKALKNAYPNNYENLKFYTFNWSGKLSHKERIIAAKDFYLSLIAEKEKLEKEAQTKINIHIITHSHGGNVGLNLSKAEEEYKKELEIEKLIMFGCPVQPETETNTQSQTFKNIYHIYSSSDKMQIADFISTKGFFSKRVFKKNKHLKSLPNNLHQIEIRIDGYKPSHYELWLWARKNTPSFIYRKKFSLYPKPVSILTPSIIKLIDSQEKISCEKSYELNFDSKSQQSYIKNKALPDTN